MAIIIHHIHYQNLHWMDSPSARNGYPGIFITRLLFLQHCRLDSEFGVINSIYHKSTANLRANCKYNSYCATHHRLAYYGVAYIAYLLITVLPKIVRDHLARLRE